MNEMVGMIGMKRLRNKYKKFSGFASICGHGKEHMSSRTVGFTNFEMNARNASRFKKFTIDTLMIPLLLKSESLRSLSFIL